MSVDLEDVFAVFWPLMMLAFLRYPTCRAHRPTGLTCESESGQVRTIATCLRMLEIGKCVVECCSR